MLLVPARGEGSQLPQQAALPSPGFGALELAIAVAVTTSFLWQAGWGLDAGLTHPIISVQEGNKKGPCLFKFLLVHMACLAVDLCPKPAELNLPRMTTVYSGFSYITAVAAFHIALIQTQR